MENTVDILKQMVANGDISKELAAKYCPEINETENDKIIKVLKKVVNEYRNKGYADYVMDIPKAAINAWLDNKTEENSKWTEKDDDHLAKAMYTCLKFYGGDSPTAGWLKKLRDRINSQYKPTKEQLESLKFIIEDYMEYVPGHADATYTRTNLTQLFNDLSKL